jgi:hypothetical protein
VTFVRQLRLLGLRPRCEACRTGGHGVTVELAHEPATSTCSPTPRGRSCPWHLATRRSPRRPAATPVTGELRLALDEIVVRENLRDLDGAHVDDLALSRAGCSCC